MRDESKKLREDLDRRDGELEKKVEKLAVAGVGGGGGGGSMMPYSGIVSRLSDNNEEFKRTREIIKKETEHLFSFMQEYVNEEAMQCLTVIKSHKKTTTEKYDALDWMVRNIEFVSPKIYTSLLKACKDAYEKGPEDQFFRTFFAQAHGSEIIATLRRLVLESLEASNEDPIRSFLINYVEGLEVVLFNNYNQEKSIEMSLHEILITILTEEVISEEVSLLSERCLSILLSQNNLILKCIHKGAFVRWIANCLKKKTIDLNLIESRLKILGIAFNSVPVAELILKQNPLLIKELFELIKITQTNHHSSNATSM
jgi:hypothetical protein